MGGMVSGRRRILCCGILDAWKHSADLGGRRWIHVALDRVCGALRWFGIWGAIDGWRIEAPVVRSVINSLEHSGLVLPFFAELDFLFPSRALVGYGAPMLEWLAHRPCLVWRGPL
jgi:hypothetical protein